MPAANGDPDVNGRGLYDDKTGLSEWYDEPKLPESVTKDQVDAAFRALGIEPRGLGLVSIEIGFRKVTVRRNVKRGGRLLPGGPFVVEFPISPSEF